MAEKKGFAFFCGKAGVARARKTVRWTVFTEQRAGRPWTPLTAHWAVIHYRPVRIPSSLFLFTKIAAHLRRTAIFVAEKKGFEPLNPFTGYTISSRAPSTKLGDFSISLIVDAAAGRRAGARADFAARRFVNTGNYIIQLPKCQYPNF